MMMTCTSTAAVTATTILLFVLPPVDVIWAFELYEAVFDILPFVNYICVPTHRDVRNKILSALKTLSVVGQKPILVQFWAPKKAGETFVLTTTHQPFGFYGRDEGLAAYHIGCLQHKLFVHREKDASFGLPGLAFRKGTNQQTANVHQVCYPIDERPLFVNEEIFSLIWGSLAVPVFLNNECVGVLEFVMTEPKHSYDAEIYQIREALKFAGLQSSAKTETPKKTCNNKKERIRKTLSSEYGRYNILAPHFGISKKDAMTELASALIASKLNLRKKDGTILISETTFTAALREAGITEWPYKKSTSTEASESTSSSPGTVLPSWDGRVFQLPLEPTPATNTSPSETYNNQPVYEPSTVAGDCFNFIWDVLEPTPATNPSPSETDNNQPVYEPSTVAGDCFDFIWDVLEPTPATNPSPSETYNNQPVYEPSTVAGDCFDFIWDVLEPTPATNPSPSETYNNQPVYEPSTVAGDCFDFIWDVLEPTPATNPSPSETYNNQPVYEPSTVAGDCFDFIWDVLEPTPATNTSPSETYNNQPVYEPSTVAGDCFNFIWDVLEPTPATNPSPSETYNNQPVYEPSTVDGDCFDFIWDGSAYQLSLEPTLATNTSPLETYNNQLAFGTSGLNSEFDGMKHQADADIDMEMG